MLLREAVFCNETPYCSELNSEPAAEQLERMLELAERYDLAHLAAFALKRGGRLGNEKAAKAFEEKFYTAIFRSERFSDELSRIHVALQAAGIDHIFLKGAVMRELYPEPWMRSSGDLDLLIRQEDRDSAAAQLESALAYQQYRDSGYHISFHSPGGLDVELHTSLMEDFFAVAEWLRDPWDTAIPMEGNQYRLSDAMYYFYHIAHMEKHFESGGCGIRPLLDLRLLDTKYPASRRDAEEMLRKAGLFDYAEASSKLAAYWFGHGQPDELTHEMQDYLLASGPFGNRESFQTAQNARAGGAVSYLLERIFPTCEKIQLRYPVLKKKPWMLPLCWVHRWFTCLNRKRAQVAAAEVQRAFSVENGRTEQVQKMFFRLGILK